MDTYADQIENAVLSEGGEVVTPSSGETAEDIAIASAILSPGIMLGGGLNVIKPERQLDPVFLALSISGGSQHRDLAKRAQGKSIVHLYNDDLADSRLHVPPDIEEQCSIGHLFNSLDDLITLRQREQSIEYRRDWEPCPCRRQQNCGYLCVTCLCLLGGGKRAMLLSLVSAG